MSETLLTVLSQDTEKHVPSVFYSNKENYFFCLRQYKYVPIYLLNLAVKRVWRSKVRELDEVKSFHLFRAPWDDR